MMRMIRRDLKWFCTETQNYTPFLTGGSDMEDMGWQLTHYYLPLSLGTNKVDITRVGQIPRNIINIKVQIYFVALCWV